MTQEKSHLDGKRHVPNYYGVCEQVWQLRPSLWLPFPKVAMTTLLQSHISVDRILWAQVEQNN